ncbi:MAG: hypothetical protein OFPII_00850 [Osedax symbiont Rs1]|nr:MAG: hypothetical protein OFPII_00850 [Osedax symbiont Rs1]
MFSKINNQLVQAADWQEVTQGTSNKIFKAEVAGRKLVLRINATQNIAFGVDRSREAKVLACIQGQAWAPVIVENNVGQGWCLMLDHGACLEPSGSLRADLPAAGPMMLALVQQLHEFSATLSQDVAKQLIFDYQGLFAEYRNKFPAGNHSALVLCDYLSQSVRELPKVSDTLVHQDLHPQNICVAAAVERAVIIDWEYAGWGSPWLDVAALNSEFMVTADNLQRLPVFADLTARDFCIGLQKALNINRALACIWYWLRLELALVHGSEMAAIANQVSLDDLKKEANQIIKELI